MRPSLAATGRHCQQISVSGVSRLALARHGDFAARRNSYRWQSATSRIAFTLVEVKSCRKSSIRLKKSQCARASALVRSIA